MSLTVKDDNISLTRGDSLILKISVMKNNEPYIPNQGDVIRFALNRDKNLETEPLILKTINTSDMLLKLDPSDTKDLKVGSYYYDIELRTADGVVDTFIGPAVFRITSEVY